MKEVTLVQLISALDDIYKRLYIHDRFVFTIDKDSNKNKFKGLSFYIKKSNMYHLYPSMEVWFMDMCVLQISYDNIDDCNLGLSSNYVSSNKKDGYFINTLINKNNLNDNFLHKKIHLKYQDNAYVIQVSTLLKNIRNADMTMFIS